MYTLYLLGQVTANPLTYSWRKAVEDYFWYNKRVNIINPCSNKFDNDILKSSNKDEMKFSDTALKEKGIELLPHMDRNLVRISNIGFINMNIFSLSRPLIGTLFELAWFFDAPEKTVIGIFSGDPTEDFQCNHPFVRAAVQSWVNNEIEACILLEKFIVKGRQK